ncbi:MAG: rhodanese-like domain-containing protein [Candidatus Competibacteraceae bacterium]|nr:rhodanese-like domain-containing protein [Candidatus Competibacteraceae bacterium]
MEDFSEFALQNWYLFLALAVILGLLIGGEVQRRLRGVTGVNPNEALRMINDQDAVVVDTRDSGEYRQGHIPNARQIPVATLKSNPKELEKFKDRPVILYCRSGMSAIAAGAALKKAGFESVYNLNGGFQAWLNANLPTSKK